jgi:ribosomal protein L11 methyltransferase
MMERQFIAITLDGLDEAGKDLATGLLAGLGYHGFEDGPNGFSAYIDALAFDQAGLEVAIRMLGVSWRKDIIREENWNALWESSFEPVLIPGKVAVRAAFHAPVAGVAHEIVITPKMSFGTGHHATTWMMMDMMLGIDFSDKQVLDFGAGTGILAILAEKLGAKSVEAVDYDPWCIDNMRENLELNNCSKTSISHSDSLPQGQTYDIVLANINRNFLLEHARGLVNLLRPGGQLLLSGFLDDDEPDITNAYLSLGIQTLVRRERNKWAALALQTRKPLAS